MDIQGLHLCLRSVLDPAVLAMRKIDDVDKTHVPERMLDLFLETTSQDLDELKALEAGQGSPEVVRLLHRICGALAVGKAKNLIQVFSDLESTVAREGLARTHANVAVFILRIELAIAGL